MASSSTLVDRVKINVLSSGTGAFQLGGAVPAYRGVEALVDGLTYSYAVESGSNYEAGTGVYLASSGQFIRIPTISSNGGAAFSFPPNVQLVFTALAQDILATGAANGAGVLVAETNYQLAILRRYAVRTNAGPLTLVLPLLSSVPLGQWIDVYDVDFQAATNPFTVSASGTDQVSAFGTLAAAYQFTVSGAKGTIVATPSSWSIVF